MEQRRLGNTAFLGPRSLLAVSFVAIGVTAASFAACGGDDAAPSGPTGTEGQACFPNGACAYGLKCASKVCRRVDGGPDSSADAGLLEGGLDSGDAGAPEGGWGVPNQCAGSGDGLTNCGGGAESCCTSPPVTGGTFSRSYDGVVLDGGFADPQYQATVANFRLDKYEVTVGRFRKFVTAAVGGWTPSAGSGKHTHLNGGSGLAASGGGNEPGWDVAWNGNLPTSKATWDSALACGATAGTWTPAAATNETRPINCVDWYDAEAFCIWDGGFLPSEAEWNYAASGGAEQRVYPWGATAPGADANLAVYGCYYNGSGTCSGITNIAPVGSVGAGNGKYGQADLAGNVWEWSLDWQHDPYGETSCANCSYLTASSSRILRGGSFSSIASLLLASNRYYGTPSSRIPSVGVRCARTP